MFAYCVPCSYNRVLLVTCMSLKSLLIFPLVLLGACQSTPRYTLVPASVQVRPGDTRWVTFTYTEGNHMYTAATSFCASGAVAEFAQSPEYALGEPGWITKGLEDKLVSHSGTPEVLEVLTDVCSMTQEDLD